MIAAGLLVTAVARYELGHPDTPVASEVAPAPARDRAAESWEPPPKPAPPPAADPGGPSILSLVEIGPAEVSDEATEPPRPAAPPATTPTPAAPPVEAAPARDPPKRALWSTDWKTRLSIYRAIEHAMDGCSALQMKHSPRLRTDVFIRVTVLARPELEYGMLNEATIEGRQAYVPWFAQCMRSALGAAKLSKPNSEVQVGLTLKLDRSEPTSESDDSSNEDADEPGADA